MKISFGSITTTYPANYTKTEKQIDFETAIKDNLKIYSKKYNKNLVDELAVNNKSDVIIKHNKNGTSSLFLQQDLYFSEPVDEFHKDTKVAHSEPARHFILNFDFEKLSDFDTKNMITDFISSCVEFIK